MKLIDMTGQKFGRLTVSYKGPPRKGGGSDWICQCECGESITVIGSNLRQGHTRSCGCLAKERASAMGADKEFIAKRSIAVTSHGHKRKNAISPEYRTWLSMKRRCYDEKFKDYPNWGGRGIKVCDRWKISFESFLEDMGLRPAGDYSIDRRDPNADYSPSNCRWATLEEQGSENRRNLTAIVFDGLSFHSIAAACRHFGVNLTTAHFRISAGIPIEMAVSFKGRLPARRGRESYLRKEGR